MINDELLLANGYKKYNDVFYHAECQFQKRIRNDKGQTKYFIDIYKYVSKVDNYEPNYEIRLCTEKEKYNLNILLYATRNEMTLKEIEKEIDDIWFKLECEYYDKEVD